MCTTYYTSYLGTIALSYPPRVRVRATVKLSAVFFHDESSITIKGIRKCNSTLFWIPLEFFMFLFCHWANSRKTKPTPRNPQNLLDPLEIPRLQKPRPLKIPHYFFLVTLGNCTSFLINPQKLHVLFLWSQLLLLEMALFS